MNIEIMKMALEALEEAHIKTEHKQDEHKREQAITALRTAITEASMQRLTDVQQEMEQEPVAWMVYTLDGKSVCVTDNPKDFTEQHRALPLYTHPPRRETEQPQVMYRLAETDIYDFAGWLTLRPGVMRVGCCCEAGPMAEAVNEYLRTFPERFTAQPPRREWVGLTDEEIKKIIGPWGDTPIKGYTRKLFDEIDAALKEKNHG